MESSLDNPNETTQSKEQTDSVTMDDRVQSAEPAQSGSNFEVGGENIGDTGASSIWDSTKEASSNNGWSGADSKLDGNAKDSNNRDGDAPNSGEGHNLNDLDGRIQAARSLEADHDASSAGMTALDAPMSVSSDYQPIISEADHDASSAGMTASDVPMSVQSDYQPPTREVDLPASSEGMVSHNATEGKDYSFTYNHEAGTGRWDSTVPHVPDNNSSKDKSGVTIGPGYDMGNRTSAEIKSDLIQAGVNKDIAEEFSDAAGLKGDDAREWINDHADLKITEDQQKQIFNSMIPEYEQRAQGYVDRRFGEGTWENLTNEQKAMLFDHTYNVGNLSKFPNYTEAVVNKDWTKAAQEYERTGADRRNQDFYNEFLSDKLKH